MSPNSTILQHLRREKRLIEFCMSSNLLDTIAEYGYDDPRFQEGLEIYDETVYMIKTIKDDYPELFERAGDTYEGVSSIYYEYRRLRKVTKVALRRNPVLLPTLNLHERIPNHIPTWITQAGQFYSRLLESEDVLKALERFNVSDEMLIQHQLVITQLEEIEELNLKESRDFQIQLDRLYTMIEKLNNWTEDLRSIIRICFDSNPEIMSAVDNFMKN
jgi:hypothetical protein